MVRPDEIEAPQAISLSELGPAAPGRQELVTQVLAVLGAGTYGAVVAPSAVTT